MKNICRGLEIYPGFSLVERFIVLLRQLSYAIKNQLVASKAPIGGLWNAKYPHWGVFCLLLAGSLWHKGYVASMHGKVLL